MKGTHMPTTPCATCGAPFERPKRSKHASCAACRSSKKEATHKAHLAALEAGTAADDNLLEALCRAGGVFAEIALNRLGDERKMAAAEMLDAGAKICVVTDLSLSEHSVSAARLYLYQRGAKPVLLGQLAAIGETVRPTVLN